MSARTITTLYVFRSESSCEKVYQTLVYNDGSLSCDCRGWTFKRNGPRTCRHVRLVECGLASSQCESMKEYETESSTVIGRRGMRADLAFAGAGRRLEFE